MFPQGPSNTALITAAARAAENKKENPLVTDPYAEILAGEDGKKLLEDYGEAFVLIETIRTKFFDDAILESIKKGKRQFVVLGAGLDTRPYRLQFPHGSSWFEIDFATVLEYKRKMLKDKAVYANIIDVYSDVTKLDMQRDLVSKGFDKSKQTTWLSEGLIPYLNDKQVDDLINFVSIASAPGSELLVTCPNKVIMAKNEVTQKRNELLARINAEWIFSGMDDPKRFFGKHGFRVDAVFVGHRKAHYNVLPWPAVEDLPIGFPKEWFIKGVKE